MLLLAWGADGEAGGALVVRGHGAVGVDRQHRRIRRRPAATELVPAAHIGELGLGLSLLPHLQLAGQFDGDALRKLVRAHIDRELVRSLEVRRGL